MAPKDIYYLKSKRETNSVPACTSVECKTETVAPKDIYYSKSDPNCNSVEC